MQDQPSTDTECENERWVNENPGSTIKWARTMWCCDCPKCELPTVSRAI